MRFLLDLSYLSLAILCHPVHKEKYFHLSQQTQESSPEAIDSDSPSEDTAPSQPPQRAPQDQDLELTDILENLFVNLPHELSVWKLSQKAQSEGVDGESGERKDGRVVVDLGGMDNDQIISDFMEEAICKALAFM